MKANLAKADILSTYSDDKVHLQNAIYRLPTPPKVITPRALYPSKVKFLVKDGKEQVC
jgi:hypothetical protein